MSEIKIYIYFVIWQIIFFIYVSQIIDYNTLIICIVIISCFVIYSSSQKEKEEV